MNYSFGSIRARAENFLSLKLMQQSTVTYFRLLPPDLRILSLHHFNPVYHGLLRSWPDLAMLESNYLHSYIVKDAVASNYLKLVQYLFRCYSFNWHTLRISCLLAATLRHIELLLWLLQLAHQRHENIDEIRWSNSCSYDLAMIPVLAWLQQYKYCTDSFAPLLIRQGQFNLIQELLQSFDFHLKAGVVIAIMQENDLPLMRRLVSLIKLDGRAQYEFMAVAGKYASFQMLRLLLEEFQFGPNEKTFTEAVKLKRQDVIDLLLLQRHYQIDRITVKEIVTTGDIPLLLQLCKQPHPRDCIITTLIDLGALTELKLVLQSNSNHIKVAPSAVHFGQLEIVKYAIERGDQLEENSFDVALVTSDNLQLFQWLKQQGYEPSGKVIEQWLKKSFATLQWLLTTYSVTALWAEMPIPDRQLSSECCYLLWTYRQLKRGTTSCGLLREFARRDAMGQDWRQGRPAEEKPLDQEWIEIIQWNDQLVFNWARRHRYYPEIEVPCINDSIRFGRLAMLRYLLSDPDILSGKMFVQQLCAIAKEYEAFDIIAWLTQFAESRN